MSPVLWILKGIKLKKNNKVVIYRDIFYYCNGEVNSDACSFGDFCLLTDVKIIIIVLTMSTGPRPVVIIILIPSR